MQQKKEGGMLWSECEAQKQPNGPSRRTRICTAISHEARSSTSCNSLFLHFSCENVSAGTWNGPALESICARYNKIIIALSPAPHPRRKSTGRVMCLFAPKIRMINYIQHTAHFFWGGWLRHEILCLCDVTTFSLKLKNMTLRIIRGNSGNCEQKSMWKCAN